MLVHLFDCDGVLLDTNNLKINALKNALKKVGASEDFITIACRNFRKNFGISRLDHFRDFELIETDSFLLTKHLSFQAMSLYSDNVISLYQECPIIMDTKSYISQLPSSEKIFVVGK